MSGNADMDKNVDFTDELPDSVNDVQLGGQKGLLSPLGDPLGKVLNTATKPLGQVVGSFGDPLPANRLKKDGDGGVDQKPVGGQEQTGQNPLGLSK